MNAITLEKIKPDWIPLLYSWRNEPETLQFNPVKAAAREEWEKRIKEATFGLEEKGKPEYLFAICKNSHPVGIVSLNTIYYGQNYANLGYSLTRDFFNQGIASEALRLFVDQIFMLTDMRRLQATTAIENIASWKVLEKNGFSREGLLKEYFIINGKPVDHYLYARLKK